jgi:hypothetical protein
MNSLKRLVILAIFHFGVATPAVSQTICDVTISDHLVGGSYEMKLGPSLLQSDKTTRNFEHVIDTDAEIYLDRGNIMLKSEKSRLLVEFVDFGGGDDALQDTDDLTLILPEDRVGLERLVGCEFANFPHMKFTGTMISTGGDETVTDAELNLAIVSVSDNEDTVEYAVGTLKASFEVPADGRVLHIRHTYYVELWSINE